MTEDKAESERWESAKPTLAQRRRVSLRRQPLTASRWYSLVIICLVLVSLAGINIAYTSYVDGQREQSEREADRRWCLLLTTLDSAYSSTPPATEIGRRVASAIRGLTIELKCDGGIS